LASEPSFVSIIVLQGSNSNPNKNDSTKTKPANKIQEKSTKEKENTHSNGTTIQETRSTDKA